jgi:hypothetical protein
MSKAILQASWFGTPIGEKKFLNPQCYRGRIKKAHQTAIRGVSLHTYLTNLRVLSEDFPIAVHGKRRKTRATGKNRQLRRETLMTAKTLPREDGKGCVFLLKNLYINKSIFSM